ncbi:MAG: hypothetical protein ACOX4J_07665 [Anaerovoracaceae bacterium]
MVNGLEMGFWRNRYFAGHSNRDIDHSHAIEILAMKSLSKDDVLLLDPGHGGVDGGAESATGVCEKAY